MLRRVTSYLLLLMYMLVSTGMYGAVHYCSDKVVSVDLYVLSEADDECSDSGCCSDETTLPDDESCCDTQIFSLEFPGEKQSANNGDRTLDSGQRILAKTENGFVTFLMGYGSFYRCENAPPLPIPFYIQNCALIYYG